PSRSHGPIRNRGATRFRAGRLRCKGRAVMKPKLYVETTIVGYLTRQVSRDVVTAAHQKITREWWDKRRQAFELYCSTLVLREASAGDETQAKERLSHLAGIPALEISSEVLALAKLFLKRKVLPPKAEDDATHLAIAAVNR